MTLAEAQQLPTVLTVQEAGRLVGLGRSAAYDAAARGDLPTIRWGRRVLVPTGRLLDLLGLNPITDAPSPASVATTASESGA